LSGGTAGEGRRLLMLRHGRTEWNHARRAQGHAPVELDGTGHEQSRRAAELLRELAPARLWSSDLRRAVQTAEHVAQACELEVEHDPRLREFGVGERQGMTFDEAVQRWPHVADAVSLGEQLRGIPGAETEDEVWDRIVPAVRDHLTSLEPGETGIAVTHGAAMKLALCGVLGWPRHVVGTLGVFDNCQWCSIELPDGRAAPKLKAYGRGDFASTEAIG
jgi:glucosyl-3-phosphoglycerate phosphatase